MWSRNSCIFTSSNVFRFSSTRCWVASSVRMTSDKPKVTMKPKRLKLYELCAEKYPEHSPEALKSWIMQGKVLVAGQPNYKPGTLVKSDSPIELIAKVQKYVCRAGFKLEAALNHFSVPVKGLVALDAGISTGGFTHCLLMNGVQRVYGVDVGYGQVSELIRTDSRVVLMERTNLRLLRNLPEKVDLVTLDLSFISILAVLPAVCSVLKPGGHLVTLIKPQFEARKEEVGEGGIIRDPEVHSVVIQKVVKGVEVSGFSFKGHISSPIKGAQGNTEFLAHFVRNLDSPLG